MRLQKFIAHSGVTSRRKAEELIQAGRVKVNGQVIIEMGVEIDPSSDTVLVDNKPIYQDEEPVYIMLHKPEGYVTTLSDEFNRPTVIDLIKDIPQRIYPVGRLDFDSSGLLLLTNDGDMTFHLTHPKHEVIKTYIVQVTGAPDEERLNEIKSGVDIGGYITAPAKVEMIKRDGQDCYISISIHEGKNRQVRRMFDMIGFPVKKLKRVAMGEIRLNRLPKGEWRHLNEKEVKYLKTISLRG